MCTIYTYMHHQTHVHHQIPPKYKIYPIGLPSVLYETPGPNERSVLNQLFLVLFIVLFTFQVKTAMLFMKTVTFHENHNAFHENLLFMKTATVFIMSFWVITRYRSFVRKTKKIIINVLGQLLGPTCLPLRWPFNQLPNDFDLCHCLPCLPPNIGNFHFEVRDES